MVDLPVCYKGKKKPFVANLPWCQKRFPKPHAPVMLDYETAIRLTSLYPETFYIATREGQGPPPPPPPEPVAETPTETLVVEVPQEGPDMPPVVHYVLDFANMTVEELSKAVRILYGKKFPPSVDKFQIYQFVVLHMENMAEEDKPTLLGGEDYPEVERIVHVE